MALKSLSADQPAGSSGNGRDVWVAAMLSCISLRDREVSTGRLMLACGAIFLDARVKFPGSIQNTLLQIELPGSDSFTK